MNYKKIISIGALAVMLSNTVVLPVAAADSTVSVDTTTEAGANTAIASFRKAANEQAKIVALKAAGDKLIDARINTLTKVAATVGGANIDTALRTSLSSLVQGQIDQLTSAKTTIDIMIWIDRFELRFQ